MGQKQPSKFGDNVEPQYSPYEDVFVPVTRTEHKDVWAPTLRQYTQNSSRDVVDRIRESIHGTGNSRTITDQDIDDAVEVARQKHMGDEWQLTKTAHETALLASKDYRSKTSGGVISGRESGTTDARPVTGTTSDPGLEATETSVRRRFRDTESATESGSGGTESHGKTTTAWPKNSTTDASSAESLEKVDGWILTTTTRADVFAAFSVINATPQSENSETLQITLSGPHGTFANTQSLRMYELMTEGLLLSIAKQSDYGLDNDPFHNVKASEDWGFPGWVGCMMRADDKMKRLKKFATKGELRNESVKDSFMDLAVYALIGMVLFEEKVNTDNG